MYLHYMQNKYVLNDKYKVSIDEAKNILKEIYNKITQFHNKLSNKF